MPPTLTDGTDMSSAYVITQDSRQQALDGVAQAGDCYLYAERGLYEAVAHARSLGASWTEIGDELGISKQGVWSRFAKS
jgi:hypothetical protein